MTIVVLAAVIFLFGSLREKRSVPLTEQSGIARFKNSRGTPVKNRCIRQMSGATPTHTTRELPAHLRSGHGSAGAPVE